MSPVFAAEIETVVITGTYTPQKISSLSSPIFVIDRRKLEELQKASVTDVLRTVPGVLVSQQGGAGGVASVSIRGGEPNFTVVMIDGVQVNDTTNSRGGSYDFNNLNINSVQRIEIIRGTQSVLYGSDALAGVINIITVAPTESIQNALNAGVGENGYYQAGYQFTGAGGALGYALNLQRLDSGEQVEGSEYRGTELTGRLEFELESRTTMAVNLRYVDGEKTSFPEQSGGPNYAVGRELDSGDSKDLTARFNIAQSIGKVWTPELNLSWFRRKDDLTSPGIVPFTEVPPNTNDSDYRRAKAAWLNSLVLSPSIDLVLGLDGRWERGESEGGLDFFGFLVPTDYQLDRNTSGGFVDFGYRSSAGLVVQASARRDDPEGFDAETTGRLGLKIPLGQSGVSLYGNVGRGYKLPSFFALGHGLVDNPDLKPKKAVSGDLGVQWQHSARGTLRLTGFYNNYEDLIDFDEAAFTNVNRDEVITRGAEFELDWFPLKSLDLRLHATYTDVDVVDTDRNLAGRPPWKAGMIADWRFLQKWALGVNYEWTDEVHASSRFTGAALEQTLDAWHRVDANVRWQATGGISLSLVVNNLLDADYQEAVGFSGPARWARLVGEFKF
jgi:outer membrane cobalamin receptor